MTSILHFEVLRCNCRTITSGTLKRFLFYVNYSSSVSFQYSAPADVSRRERGAGWAGPPWPARNPWKGIWGTSRSTWRSRKRRAAGKFNLMFLGFIKSFIKLWLFPIFPVGDQRWSWSPGTFRFISSILPNCPLVFLYIKFLCKKIFLQGPTGLPGLPGLKGDPGSKGEKVIDHFDEYSLLLVLPHFNSM